jgi:hypothetical protein
MKQFIQPSKEQVRQWLAQRQVCADALPELDQIRRELGWGWRPAQEARNPVESVDGI